VCDCIRAEWGSTLHILALVFNRSIATCSGGYYYRYNNYYYYGPDGKKRERSKTESPSRTAITLDTGKRA
jgi:hypothetical protein